MISSKPTPPTSKTSTSKRPGWLVLGVLVVTWGMQAIVVQSLLLREALVLLFGSELAWGIVLFAWLFGVAVGAGFGGWFAAKLRRADVALVTVLLLLSAASCVDLWVFRGARAWMGVPAGELMPLGKTALAAMLFVSPASALVGIAFPLACRLAGGEGGRRADRPSGVGSLGGVYGLESAGSLIGGAVFSFWAVEHLAPIETGLWCGVVTAGASAVLMAGTAGKRFPVVGLAVLALAIGLVATLAGGRLDRRLVDRRWRTLAPGYRLCAHAESRYQNLAVGRRAEQFTLFCDGQLSADFPDPYTYVPLAHLWMCQHPSPRRVLVLGGGAEGLLAEILRHPVEGVDYVEADPRQIELIEPFLAESDRRALCDYSVTVHYLDARYFVKTRGTVDEAERFDLVIARLPEPTSALRARFYTDEFYGELRRAMSDESVLCMTAAAAPSELTTASARYLASIRATLHRHFPHVTVGWGDPAQILAATRPGLVSTDATMLARRYAERGVQSALFHPLWFDGATDWLDADKVKQRAAELNALGKVAISTDLRPVVYAHRLVLWERMTGGASGGLVTRLRRVGWFELVAGFVVAGGVLLLAYWFRYGARLGFSAGAIVLSVATTGFVTMALSIIWLFAFQNLYGYVYQRIGWIIAVFMAGLVVGCSVVNWRARCAVKSELLLRYLWRRLIAVDLLLAALALAVPVVLPALGDIQTTHRTFVLVEVVVSVLVAVTGLLGGATFALAGGLQLETMSQAGAAGSVVGADHAGACIGALVTGILLVPIFGTASAALLLVGVKVGSALVLVCVFRGRLQ